MIRRILFLFFLGLPGLAFQLLGGLAGIFYAAAFCSMSGLAWWELGVLLLPVVVFTVGAVMQAHFDATEQVHLSTAEVVAVAVQKTLALLAMMAMGAAVVLLAKGEDEGCIAAGILMVVFCGGFTACVVYRRRLYRQHFNELLVESSDR